MVPRSLCAIQRKNGNRLKLQRWCKRNSEFLCFGLFPGFHFIGELPRGGSDMEAKGLDCRLRGPDYRLLLQSDLTALRVMIFADTVPGRNRLHRLMVPGSNRGLV